MNVDTSHLLICSVTAVEGCHCAPNVRWFNCRCSEAVSYDYKVTPYNWLSVVTGEEGPDEYPSPEGVADVMAEHPTAKLVYCDTKLYGPGHMSGATIHELALKELDKRKEVTS